MSKVILGVMLIDFMNSQKVIVNDLVLSVCHNNFAVDMLYVGTQGFLVSILPSGSFGVTL